MSNKIVIGEYLKRDSSIYQIVPISNSPRINYTKEGNFFDENNFLVFGFSDKNLETKSFSPGTSDFLELKRSVCKGGSLLSLLSFGALMGVVITSFAYENPVPVSYMSFAGGTLLGGGALFLEKLSDEISQKITRRRLGIETFFSKINVNVLNDAKNYISKSREKKFSKNKINKGLNKIYLENIL